VTLLVEEFGADRRIVIRPHVGDTSPGSVLVDVNHVADVREFTGGAFVLAGAALSVRLDELHVEGLHRRKHRDERGVSERPAPAERLQNQAAFLSRSDLCALGLERRAIDAVFRACPVVALPGYSRPLT
jgi:hypothetical protein